MKLTGSDFFFCYNKQMAEYIMKQFNIAPITIARNVKTNLIYSLFERCGELQVAIDSYSVQLHCK